MAKHFYKNGRIKMTGDDANDFIKALKASLNEPNHTPEPWQYFPNETGDYSIVKNQDEPIQIFIVSIKSQHDAKRIVRCINAMDGIVKAWNDLMNAPHYEHFAVRLNDQELEAFEKLKLLMKEVTHG